MAYATRISSSQKRGRTGELEIKKRVSSFSNVMSPEFDIGVDYFCILLEAKKPTYFYVQAKSTQSFDSYWTKGVPKETVRLWLIQRFPVFLILFEESNRNCYWYAVEDNRRTLVEKLSSNARSIAIKIDRSHALGISISDNIEFIKKIKHGNLLLNALYGIPEMIGEGYIGAIPVLYLSETARENLKNTVRLGMNYLINDSWLKEDPQQAYQYLKILAKFDQSHYDHFLYLARISLRLGKKAEAERNYATAIKICERDKSWDKRRRPSDPFIKDIIEMIKRDRERLMPNS